MSACGTFGNHDETPDTLFPAARFVERTDTDERYSEYLVEGVISEADGLGQLPMADGPLRVDCKKLKEIGMIVRHANWKGVGLHHAYNFELANNNEAGEPPDYFSFETLMWRGYVRGRVRFKTPPHNGTYTMSAIHRRQVLLTTEFEFYGCN